MTGPRRAAVLPGCWHLVLRGAETLCMRFGTLGVRAGTRPVKQQDSQQQEDWSWKLFVDLINVVDFDWPVEDAAAFQ